MMNRMARYIPGFLFVFTSMLMSCENENEPLLKNISFGTQVEEMQSRAPFVDNEEDEDDFNTFAVWGNYNGNQPVFTNQEVHRSTSQPTGVWYYSPSKSWNMAADSYVFSAYSPYGVGTPTVVNNLLTSLTFDSNAHPVDLMLAYTPVEKEDIGKTVVPTFNHALGAVNFTFKLKSGFNYVNTYRVTGVQLDNVYTSGLFALNNGNTITPSTTGTPGKTNTITSFTGGAFTISQAMTSDYLFVIPQQSAVATLRLTLDVNGESIELTKENFSINWTMGKKTTYNITLDPLQDFSITVVTTAWDTPVIPDIVVGSN